MAFSSSRVGRFSANSSSPRPGPGAYDVNGTPSGHAGLSDFGKGAALGGKACCEERGNAVRSVLPLVRRPASKGLIGEPVCKASRQGHG